MAIDRILGNRGLTFGCRVLETGRGGGDTSPERVKTMWKYRAAISFRNGQYWADIHLGENRETHKTFIEPVLPGESGETCPLIRLERKIRDWANRVSDGQPYELRLTC